ncbi:MAG TPA: hypothetical protein VFF69_01330 [Phycisphaerales bacterium]|nr:hypothetical protein [Phycisphaerales bacterium]
MKSLRRVTGIAALIVIPGMARAQTEEKGPGDAEIIDGIADAVVMVEHTFRYDNGEAPRAEPAGLAYASAEGDVESDWSAMITQERPAERQGYLIAPDLVLTVDPLVHARFVEKIEVRAGERVVRAHPEAHAVGENALLLRLEEPLAGVEPLEFDGAAEGPYRAVHGRLGNGRWWLSASGVDTQTVISRDGPRYHASPWPSLIVSKGGTPVSACFDGMLELDGSWKRPPSDWRWMPAAELEEAIAKVGAAADAALPRVELRFRSPAQQAPQSPYGWGEDYEQEITEWNGTGVLLDERRVLVLAHLKPKLTARLETVLVHLADGREIPAEFRGSLRDYGAMLVELSESAPGAAAISARGIMDVEDELLVRSQVRVLGESRTSYEWQARLARMTRGYRGSVLGSFGDVSASGQETGDGQEGPMSFLFTPGGELVALPLMVREKVATEAGWDGGGWSRASQTTTVLAAGDVERILASGEGAIDPDNRPLSEAEEHRLAWLGVELQAMDPDLARFNDVVEQTNGGQTGGIVTYVYGGSPAAKAGMQVGDVLLRLHVQGQPRPVEVQVSPYDMGWGGQFIEALDQIDPEYFDQVPPPWGGAETMLTRALTDVGFGTPFAAEVFRGGGVLSLEFVVEEGPAHFGAAAKFKSEAAGLTVKDVTYEVRRFFQLAPEDPGVIVAKIEQGELAAVAGLKPYELIVSVNDEPVHSVEEFEGALAAGGEMRFGVKRLHVGRIVKLRLPEE